jgi:hypothetical protein
MKLPYASARLAKLSELSPRLLLVHFCVLHQHQQQNDMIITSSSSRKPDLQHSSPQEQTPNNQATCGHTSPRD